MAVHAAIGQGWNTAQRKLALGGLACEPCRGREGGKGMAEESFTASWENAGRCALRVIRSYKIALTLSRVVLN